MSVRARDNRWRDELDAHAEIARLIYRSILGDEDREPLLSRLTREFDATYSVVLTRNRLTHSVRITATDALPMERRLAYQDYYARLSPSSFFGRVDSTIGEVLTDRLYQDYDAYLNGELYNEFFRPLRADHLMFLPLGRTTCEEKSLVVRRSREAGFYGDESVRRLTLVGGHLTNAERLLEKTHCANERARNLGSIIERMGGAAFVTDRGGTIRYMSAAAERLVRCGEIFVALGGRLGTRDLAVERALQAAIRDCAESLDRPEKKARQIVPVTAQERGRPRCIAFVAAVAWSENGREDIPASLVLVNDAGNCVATRVRTTARVFGLTPAEAAVAAALCEGFPVCDYAVREGVSVQTARTLVKRALAKTETHSQAELISLLLRSVSSIGFGEAI